MHYQTLLQVIENRRSIYALNRDLPLPAGEIVSIIKHALYHAPSPFNTQSTRLLVLFGYEHERLWDIVADVLRAAVPADKFAPTAQKLAGFRAAAGTILFYEDSDIIAGLQQRFPNYADTFPGSADKADAMLQYALWTTFTAAGIGVNIQHYNPLIDAEVAKTWDIPAHWRLRTQMLFGGIAAPAGEKTHEPLDTRIRICGL